MNDDHTEYREWAAAYVLGALDPDERAHFERHLPTCERCQADVSEFSPIPGLLARLDPTADTESDAATRRITALAIARADHDYDDLRSARRRWRATALSAAAVVIVLVAAFAVVSLRGSEGGGTQLAFSDTNVTGTVSIDDHQWGTSVDLDLEGLPRREMYQLWVIANDGSRRSAATWTGTEIGAAVLIGSAAIAAEDIDFVAISSADADDIVWRTN